MRCGDKLERVLETEGVSIEMDEGRLRTQVGNWMNRLNRFGAQLRALWIL